MPDRATQNPLSCKRCKLRKIRCDRVEPICNKCQEGQAECEYLPRRPRAKKKTSMSVQSQQHSPSIQLPQEQLLNILSRLSRLEELEERRHPGLLTIRPDEELSEASRASSISAYGDNLDSPTSLPRLVAEATAVAKGSLGGSEPSTPGSPENLHVLRALENVDLEIRQFQQRPKKSLAEETASIPKDLITRWINVFYDSYGAMPACLSLDRQYILSLTNLIEMPHVTVDTSAVVTYYNVIFQGMLLDEDAIIHRPTYSNYLYRKCLKLVEKWETGTKPGLVDLHAAMLMSWFSCEKLDINLAWKFHCKACNVGRDLGYFAMDTDGQTYNSQALMNGTAVMEIEARKNDERYTFWQLQCMDAQFRLHFSKPCVIRPGTWKVNFPSIQPDTQLDDLQQVFEVHFIVSMRLAFVTLKYFEYKDTLADRGASNPDDADTFIDSLIGEIESFMQEWEVEHRFITSNRAIDAWLLADLLFNSKTTIILLYRAKRKKDNQSSIPREPLEAARRIIFFVKKMCSGQRVIANYSMSFVSYYPLVSVITLYSNALQTNDIAEAESDLALTEWLGATLRAWVEEREELKPVSHVVNALNGVCRQVLSLKTPRIRLQQATKSSNNDILGYLNSGDIELNSLIQDPLEYMRQLEREVYQTDPHQHWWV